MSWAPIQYEAIRRTCIRLSDGCLVFTLCLPCSSLKWELCKIITTLMIPTKVWSCVLAGLLLFFFFSDRASLSNSRVQRWGDPFVVVVTTQPKYIPPPACKLYKSKLPKIWSQLAGKKIGERHYWKCKKKSSHFLDDDDRGVGDCVHHETKKHSTPVISVAGRRATICSCF